MEALETRYLKARFSKGVATLTALLDSTFRAIHVPADLSGTFLESLTKILVIYVWPVLVGLVVDYLKNRLSITQIEIDKSDSLPSIPISDIKAEVKELK